MKRQTGFTLLEIMIAITIMTVAFGAILTSQSGSIHHTIKAKEMNIAGWLARDLMVQSEHLMEGKPFSELKDEETGRFPAPFERFGWKREVRELKFPEISLPKKEGQTGVLESVRLLAKMMTKFFNDSVKELVITVTWPRGEGEEQLTLTTYLVDMESEFKFSL